VEADQDDWLLRVAAMRALKGLYREKETVLAALRKAAKEAHAGLRTAAAQVLASIERSVLVLLSMPTAALAADDGRGTTGGEHGEGESGVDVRVLARGLGEGTQVVVWIGTRDEKRFNTRARIEVGNSAKDVSLDHWPDNPVRSAGAELVLSGDEAQSFLLAREIRIEFLGKRGEENVGAA
jgi:hypothetical protein